MLNIRTLDLFSGAGGSSFGASQADPEVQIMAGLDFCPNASETYKCNFPQSQHILQDIGQVSPRELYQQIGNIDLILASPECTNHSCAKGSAPRCEESKLTAFQVLRFAEVFKPKWIVIENVVQMKTWSRHPELLEKLWELGYFVREEKLNSMYFGVPQSRRRLFLLCSRTGKGKPLSPDISSIQNASSIIDTSDKYKFSCLHAPKRAKATLERAKRAIDTLGKDTPFLIVYYGTDGSGGWQTLDKPLRTITTLDRFAYVKPTPQGHMMRMLQPDELKLAMGFPADYQIVARTRRERIKLLGNAVCPPVMKHIVRSLIT